jgi:hypothetical protein
MTPQTERRFINHLIKHNNPKTMKDVAVEIKQANARLLKRRSDNTDLQLEAELRACEIRRCLPILNEME